MTLYEELQQAYDDQDAAIHLQLNLLAKAAGNMVSGLPDYLGLTDKKWHLPDGKVGGAYVRLGEGHPDAFQETPWLQLSLRNSAVAFSVAIAIFSTDQVRRINYIFEMDVRFCDQGYKFSLKDQTTVTVTAAEVKAGVFEAVHQLVVSRLKQLLDPKQIMIKV